MDLIGVIGVMRAADAPKGIRSGIRAERCLGLCNMKIMFKRSCLRASLAVALLVTTAACGSRAAPDAQQAPVKVTSCGLPLEVSSPPRRAVALEQNATEIMLTLGLADRMAGTSYQTDPVLPELAKDYRSVPVLAAQYPSREALLEKEPDFLYSTLSSAYAPEAAGDRKKWQSLKTPAYLSAHDCEEPGRTVSPAAFQPIFDEIGDIARIFSVPERGRDVVSSLRQRLQAAGRPLPGGHHPKLMWYYSGTRTPHIAGRTGLPQTISDLVGARNAFADANDKWPEGNWEEIARRNPDVIVLADLTRGGDGDSAQAKKQFLRTHPVTAHLDAVRNDRFIVVPGSAMDPSVRSVSAVEAVGEGLRKLYR